MRFSVMATRVHTYSNCTVAILWQFEHKNLWRETFPNKSISCSARFVLANTRLDSYLDKQLSLPLPTVRYIKPPKPNRTEHCSDGC